MLAILVILFKLIYNIQAKQRKKLRNSPLLLKTKTSILIILQQILMTKKPNTCLQTKNFRRDWTDKKIYLFQLGPQNYFNTQGNS